MTQGLILSMGPSTCLGTSAYEPLPSVNANGPSSRTESIGALLIPVFRMSPLGNKTESCRHACRGEGCEMEGLILNLPEDQGREALCTGDVLQTK